MKQFGLIGGGTMGGTFVASLLANAIATPDAITVCEILETRRDWLREANPDQVSASSMGMSTPRSRATCRAVS